MKICSICKKEKEINCFSKRNDRKSGVQSRCKECHKDYRKTHLKQERITKSIYRKKNSKEINDYHVIYNRNRDNGLYLKWCGILKRLTSEVDSYSYKDRGIKCLWNNYQEFKNDMYESFLVHLKKYGKIQTSLDRINNDGNYSKENCRWANWEIQNKNKREYRKKILV